MSRGAPGSTGSGRVSGHVQFLVDTPGLAAISPDERNLAYETVGLRATDLLTRAAVIRVAESAQANLALVGTYDIGGESRRSRSRLRRGSSRRARGAWWATRSSTSAGRSGPAEDAGAGLERAPRARPGAALHPRPARPQRPRRATPRLREFRQGHPDAGPQTARELPPPRDPGVQQRGRGRPLRAGDLRARHARLPAARLRRVDQAPQGAR